MGIYETLDNSELPTFYSNTIDVTFKHDPEYIRDYNERQIQIAGDNWLNDIFGKFTPYGKDDEYTTQ